MFRHRAYFSTIEGAAACIDLLMARNAEIARKWKHRTVKPPFTQYEGRTHGFGFKVSWS